MQRIRSTLRERLEEKRTGFLIAFRACILWAVSGAGCGSQPGQAPALDVEWDDPIAATFENCGSLFRTESNPGDCGFTARRERGYDVVEEKVTCRQQNSDVSCELRPGPGAGPDLNWINYACDRTSRKCRITGGELSFTSGYATLFAGHNAGLESNRTVALPETR